MFEKITFLTVLVNILMIACTTNKEKQPERWTEKELTEWFKSTSWRHRVKIDEQVDKRELAFQYFKNKKRWDKAFCFLEDTDLESINVGKYYLDSINLFVIVEEYMTKNIENTRFEAHRKYADIQYLVIGEEKIGVAETSKLEATVPYDENKDVGFYKSAQDNFRLVQPREAFIFFPHDAHRPGFKVEENIMVKKIVLKVKVN